MGRKLAPGAALAAAGAISLLPGVAAPPPASGSVTAATGSDSTATHGQALTRRALPACETLDAAGSSALPVITDTATGVCESVEPVINDLGDTVRGTLPDGNDETSEPATHSGHQVEQQGSDNTADPGNTAGANPPDESPTRVADTTSAHSDAAVTGDPAAETERDATAAEIESGTLPTPNADPPVTAPDLDRPESSTSDPEIRAQAPDPGVTGLLPDNQPRVPLVFAVTALAAAATTASRRVARDKG